MKQKILFVTSRMNVGGVEKALLGLLSTIDFSQNDVTLGLIYKFGDLFVALFLPVSTDIHAAANARYGTRFCAMLSCLNGCCCGDSGCHSLRKLYHFPKQITLVTFYR